MNGFHTLLNFGFKRRIKDQFIIMYNLAFPLILILLLGYLATNFFKGDSNVTSNDYYSFVMLPFFVFSSIITMVYVAKDESLYKTSYRFLIAPISGFQIIMSKIISCTVTIWVSTLIVMIIIKILLGVSFSYGLSFVLILFFTEAFMASAIGIFIGYSFKNFETIKGIISIPINLFGIIGGTFFPIGSLGKTFMKVSYISPLTWVNKGIIALIYDKDSKLAIYSIIITLILGMVFSVVSVLAFKKEAFL